MKQLLLAASALALTAAAPTPVPTIPAPAIVAALRDDALANDHYAWDIVEGLTTEVGQRLAATEAEARARDWAVKRLTAMGFANVHVEPYAMPVFQRGAESAEIVAPFPQKLVLTALGNSGATPPQGVIAEVVAFDSIDALKAAPDEAVRGKIVFVDHHMTANQDGSGYGQFGQPRRAGPTIAGHKGALAIVVRSAGTDHHRYGHTGAQSLGPGVTSIPAGALSVPDAEQLMRILARGKPVTMHLTLTPKYLGDGPSGNVVAEVPGRDPSLPAVLVGGHLDSWDLGTGAIDDGAGVAIATAAAKRIMDAGRPLRTIRIVWFGAEEPGLIGANAYQKGHTDDRYFAVAESDEGADRVWKIDTKLGAEHQAEADALFAATAPLGIVKGKTDSASGSDIEVMLNVGTPGVTLHQDATRYFDIHHTPDDTLDKIDAAQLRQNVATWTTMLAVLSGGIAEPKRRIPR
jgi:carboxypeptidase Q